MHPVLHISPALFGHDGYWGGGERYVTELARAQAEVVPTRLISVGSDARQWSEGKLEIAVLPERYRWRDHELGRLSERLVPEIARSRVVHIHQYNTGLASAAILIANALKKPVFVTDHGGSGPNLNRKLRLYNRVRRYLAVSQFSTYFFPELAKRSSVIYAGVDADRFAPPPLGHERAPEVVFIGRIMPHKGIDILIDAVRPDTTVHVFGRPYDPAYLAYLHERATGKQVIFHHDSSEGDIVRALQRARVAVLPSVYQPTMGFPAPKSEYFGLVLAEAMACGTPVVGTRVGGIPEVIDERAGRLVEPNDAIALGNALGDILSAPAATWAEMSKASRERVTTTFTWPIVARRCLEMYDSSPK